MNNNATAIRILLVDDHPMILWGLQKLIENEQPQMEVVGTAGNCTDALAALHAHQPDIVLLDLDLDGNSAIDILPELVSNGISRVLILTGTRDQALLENAVRHGARGIVRKDAPPAKIIKAIEKTFQGELWFDHEMLCRVFSSFIDTASGTKQKEDEHLEETLTQRERAIIQAVVEGNGAVNKALAERLFISEHTLRNHLTSIYQKLGVGNRLELYIYATKHHFGIVTS